MKDLMEDRKLSVGRQEHSNQGSYTILAGESTVEWEMCAKYQWVTKVAYLRAFRFVFNQAGGKRPGGQIALVYSKN